jgi:tetratricopeptide (TPR) repeat protein
VKRLTSWWLAALLATSAPALAAQPPDDGAMVFDAHFIPVAQTGRACAGEKQDGYPLRLILDRGGSAAFLELDGVNIYRAQRLDEREFRIDIAGADAARSEDGRLRLDAAVVALDQRPGGWLRLESPWSACIFAGDVRFEPAAQTVDPAGVRRQTEIAAEIQSSASRVRALEVAGKLDESLVQARALVERAEALLGPDDRNTSLTMSRLASVLWSMGRYEEAATAGERAVAILRRTVGLETIQSAFAANDLGLIYRDAGRYPESLSLFRDAHAAAERALGSEHLHTARLLYNLGLLWSDVYRFDEALPAMERAYLIRAKALGEDDRATLRAQEAIASIMRKAGRIEDAAVVQDSVYQAYVRTLGPDDGYTLYARTLLGVYLVKVGRIEEGLAHQEAALAALQPRFGPWHLYSRQAFYGYVLDLIEVGQLDRADALLAVHMPTMRNAKVPASHVVNVYMARARLDAKRGNWQASEDSAEEALAAGERAWGKGHSALAATQALRANALARLGRRDEAIMLLEDWVQSTERLRASTGLGEAYRQALLADRHVQYRDLAALYAQAGRAEDTFRAAELLKARSLLDTLATRNALLAAGLTSEEGDRLNGLTLQVAKLNERLARAPAASEARFELEVQRNAVERESARLRQSFIDRSPKAQAMTRIEIIDAPQARRVLRPGEAAVSYLFTDELVYALVVTPAKPLALVELGSSRLIRGAIEALSALLSAPAGQSQGNDRTWRLADGAFVRAREPPAAGAREVTAWSEPAAELGRLVLAPLLPRLGNARTWYVAPDTPLAAVPIDALLLGGRPVVLDRTIVNVQSMSVLAAIRARPAPRTGAAGGSVLAVGGPDYGGGAASAAEPRARSADGAAQRSALALRSAAATYEELGPAWTALPGSGEEARAVFNAMTRRAGRGGGEPARLLLGRDASEARLQQLARDGTLARYRYLHFATHGYLNPDSPALSAIVLSLVEPTADADGYVTAAEWAAYSLDSELIVLSACETGRGQQLPGEGILGLPYALFVAGNRSAILTLWKIDDRSTRRFVEQLFERIARGTTPAQALAQTRREFARSARYRHPYHWAGFVIYGP